MNTNKQPPIFISAAEIAQRLNCTGYSVRAFIEKNGIKAASYANAKKTRPLYGAQAIKLIKDGCPKRKTTTPAKSKVIPLRLNATEHAMLSSAAAKFGMPISTFLKAVAAKRKPAKRQVNKVIVADPELLRQLAWIGNNMNQIARVMNQARLSGDLSGELATMCYASIADIEDMMQQLVFEFD